MSKLSDLFSGVAGTLMFVLILLVALGDLYWLWMSIQLGSFAMFVAGLFPPLIIITGPVGAWSLLFGAPDWLVKLFG
ncbi:MAG: hypothetical protein OQJ95_03525 [Kangiella sp.]|jgi:hypothetical protein|nr:hypothetical protein [Kangiella sp.]